MKKLNNTLLVILFITLIGLQTNVTAQVTTLGNGFPGVATDYSGWNATRLFPFTVAHKGNFPINFQTNGIQRMTIRNGTGFVGIGLGFAAPNFLLDVNGGDINVNSANRGYRIASSYVLWHNGIASNIYVGVNAGSALSTGIQNTFVGSGSGNQNTSADANAFFGYNAGTNTTTGSQNTFLGHLAGVANTVGFDNTYVGDRAGENMISGIQNTFVGHHAGASFVGGTDNVAIGWHSSFGGPTNSNGSRNTIVGSRTIISLTTGNNNSLLGYNTGNAITSGLGNTLAGANTGNNITTGVNNCAFGTNAGNFITTGSNNLFLGTSSDANASGLTNANAIGFGANVTASNKMILGNNNIMVGIGLSNAAIAPQNKLEIDAGINLTNPSPNGTVGASGLRFRDLHFGNLTVTNPGTGVLSVDANGDVIYVDGGTGVGNYCSAPLQNSLIGNYEIPLNNFDYYFSGQNTPLDNRVSIGSPCSTVLPAAKLNVLEQSLATVSAIPVTIAGAFANRDLPASNVPFTAIGVYGISDAVQGSANQRNIGGLFRAENTRFAVGVMGRSVTPQAGVPKYGVFGEAIGGGVNYSIYGTSSPITTASATNQSWAVYSNGAAYYTTAYSPSDGLIKKNVVTISNAISIVNQLNPIKFNFDVALGASKGMNLPNSVQYGFKAQEVEVILPELVTGVINPALYDSLGNEIIEPYSFKALNYNAFIGILTKAVQEQQSQILSKDSAINSLNDRLTALENCINGLNLCGNNQAIQQNNANNQNSSITNIELKDAQSIVLEQNVPNPFAEQTTINYFLPDEINKAQLLFYNAQGKLIQSLELIQKGKGSINVFASDLSNGIYTYTLVVDGKIIETKKMVKN
jgi:hypothetical protein